MLFRPKSQATHFSFEKEKCAKENRAIIFMPQIRLFLRKKCAILIRVINPGRYIFADKITDGCIDWG